MVAYQVACVQHMESSVAEVALADQLQHLVLEVVLARSFLVPVAGSPSVELDLDLWVGQ